MTSRATELTVFAHLPGESNAVPAGRLTLTEQADRISASRFVYGLRYLDRPNALPADPVSLALTQYATARGHELYPAARRPLFGAIADLAPGDWGRRVIESQLGVPADSLPDVTYLTAAGAERAGALELRVALDSPAPPAAAAPLARLGHLHIAAERIEAGADLPEQLHDIYATGSSLGGARPKATVLDEDGRHWIAKFSSRNDRIDVPVIEAATLRLAAAAGLNVPRLRVAEFGGWRKALLVERFDRNGAGLPAGRRHFVSARTLLSASGSAEPSNQGYGDIADALRRHGVARHLLRDTTELYTRMVFNIFVTNDHDHLDNHGVLWDNAARGWMLSPLYDVVPRPMLAADRFLQLGVGREGRAATLTNAISEYSRFGLTRDGARACIHRVWEVARRWRELFEAFGVPRAEIDKVQSAFRHVHDIGGESLLMAEPPRQLPVRRAA